MEFASLLTNTAAEKTYKHFANNPSQAKDQTGKKTEFLFIGKNYRKIDFLINTFESGYIAENVTNAISILRRILGNNHTPDIIIVDGIYSETSLNELHNFISSVPAYAFVPLVLDASDLTENELKKYRTCHFLDEIIFIDERNDKLLRKIEFLKKVKRQVYQQLVQDSIQTSIAAIYEPKNLGKRFFDITISVLAILLLAPVFLLIALAIKLESKGPVFYVSQRAGRGYRIFNFYKFRTMIMDADKDVEQLSHLNQYDADDEIGPVFFKVINDPRITKVGMFLRNTSLDELPQFFNVLLGHMSFVGNRPLPLYEAARLTTDEWAARFMAPAGITGLWQIKKRGQDNMSMQERINLDIDYAHKYNFMYDLWIMLNTPSALIQKSNT